MGLNLYQLRVRVRVKENARLSSSWVVRTRAHLITVVLIGNMFLLGSDSWCFVV